VSGIPPRRLPTSMQAFSGWILLSVPSFLGVSCERSLVNYSVNINPRYLNYLALKPPINIQTLQSQNAF
jgi:hypothetical protein